MNGARRILKPRFLYCHAQVFVNVNVPITQLTPGHQQLAHRLLRRGMEAPDTLGSCQPAQLQTSLTGHAGSPNPHFRLSSNVRGSRLSMPCSYKVFLICFQNQVCLQDDPGAPNPGRACQSRLNGLLTTIRKEMLPAAFGP
jgi:hypothetical protein